MNPKKYTTSNGTTLQYYCKGSAGPKLVMLHAQGTSSKSFEDVADVLSRGMQVYLIDCPGHGGSSKDPSLYTLAGCGDAILELITNEIGGPIALLGHSSGGLIAAYIASKSVLCARLILEDAPLFSCVGERRKQMYNYVDLSTVCHNYLASGSDDDFVLYYFENQYAWNFFPEKTREKTRKKFIASARKSRAKHPSKDLKVMFWPGEAFIGMNDYDPRFGEAFYTDSFNEGIDYEKLLGGIKCRTLFMKATCKRGEDGIFQGALTDEELEHVLECIPRVEAEHFHCGHGIHVDRNGDFNRSIKSFIMK
ncbi:MAG: alpha/beta hydrolase [Bacillota bacterium]|nr:alpha/beta hydrolase [Bacillota bacterium]